MEKASPLKRALEMFNGSQSELARALGVTQPAVWSALKRNRVSPEMAAAIERATEGKVLRTELRPDIFGTAPASPDAPELARAVG